MPKFMFVCLFFKEGLPSEKYWYEGRGKFFQEKNRDVIKLQYQK